MTKYKIIHGKRIPNMSTLGACSKLFDHLNLKILIPKQMLQKLPVALAQVKAAIASKNLLTEI